MKVKELVKKIAVAMSLVSLTVSLPMGANAVKPDDAQVISFFEPFETALGAKAQECCIPGYSNIAFYAGLESLYNKTRYAYHCVEGDIGLADPKYKRLLDAISKLQFNARKKSSGCLWLKPVIVRFYDELYALSKIDNSRFFLDKAVPFVEKWKSEIEFTTSWIDESIPQRMTDEFELASKAALANVKTFLETE